ncbi:LHFPL tetraspan subfamily member 2b isoform X1 [Denticeps clupeoides]|uniref:Uncharacterized protein n=1 Tax=Denticeps clupeoides TaxID=299321 RepID=A0AAY4BPM1_9TELE|nr:LHFPL tetraspan subfamily member 2a protein-like isoform X1 [Denticeps clupeoides]XP_028852061.1 LHFPL tetraspan subfamily member 2a protein-like isoform X1 [Denticeps clupeoides]XP_028852062.1 LHFPL tetraspan subfamily member 2a protein-like isoform X1 [Denticeps clupeoides]
MCKVIVTCRSMLWTLLSIVVAFAELVAFMDSEWLVGPSISPSPNSSISYQPTLGLYGRCRLIQQRSAQCGPYAENFGEIASNFWKVTAIFLAVGLLILVVVALLAVFSLCFQSIMGKSLFNVCGLVQAIAGFFLLLGLVFYPVGWGCEKVKQYCGEQASPFRNGGKSHLQRQGSRRDRGGKKPHLRSVVTAILLDSTTNHQAWWSQDVVSAGTEKEPAIRTAITDALFTFSGIYST